MMNSKLLIGILTIGVGGALHAQTIIHNQTFDTSVTNWSIIGDPPGMAAATATFNAVDGNGPGSYDLSVAPLAGPAFAGFRYEVTGLDFGVGPVTVSFDGQITDLMSAATHVRINGNFHGAVMGSFNDTSWSNYSQTYDLANGFDATTTLTIDFEFGLGAVDPTGGNWHIDNVMVSTTPVPEPSTYAVVLGALAVGFVAMRRRSKR